MLKFFKRQKYRRMIKGTASFILKEIAEMVVETIDHFKKEGKIKNQREEEVMKFELIALSFWLFKNSGFFQALSQGLSHKTILDEIHNQYYEGLKKNGYDSKARQLVCDDFNLHYRKYDEIYENDSDLTIVSVEFSKFLSKKLNTEKNLNNVMFAMYLVREMTAKFQKWSKVID